MGCDIHPFIDYVDWTGTDGKTHVSNFAQLRISRDYLLFGVLADVRFTGLVTTPRRGLPQELSYQVTDAAYLYIVDEESDDGGTCTLKSAQAWKNPIELTKDGKPWRTLHPDWHSHSYLYVDEVEKALAVYKKTCKYPTDERSDYLLEAIIAAMRAINGTDPKRSWFVFWFDN